MFSIKKRLLSFRYAFNGIKEVVCTQHNFWIDIVLAIMAVTLGFLLKINTFEWLIVIVVISLVLAAETFNTAIEYLVDMVSPEENKTAGKIKDIAAGAVLITAIGALITGIIIFLPKIIESL